MGNQGKDELKNMARWFRFYDEVLNDPKVQTLDPLAFKVWVNCLCLASANDSPSGKLGTLEAVSFALRETLETVSSAFHTLCARGLIATENETFHIPKWGKRQYKSDTSTDRVKRFRERSRNVTETVPDTETDKEKKEKKTSPVGEAKEKPIRGSRLPRNWSLPDPWRTWAVAERPELDVDKEAEKFRDFWWAKSGKDGTKIDWEATWRNWIRNARAPDGSHQQTYRKSAAERAADDEREYERLHGRVIDAGTG